MNNVGGEVNGLPVFGAVRLRYCERLARPSDMVGQDYTHSKIHHELAVTAKRHRQNIQRRDNGAALSLLCR